MDDLELPDKLSAGNHEEEAEEMSKVKSVLQGHKVFVPVGSKKSKGRWKHDDTITPDQYEDAKKANPTAKFRPVFARTGR